MYFPNHDCDVDAKVHVIYLKDDNNNIINQYIKFCLISNNQFKKYGYTAQAVRNTIDFCIKNDILSKFLNENRSEVEKIMIDMYRQSEATDFLIKKAVEEAIPKAKIESIREMIQNGATDIEKIKATGCYTEQELKAIMA